MVAPGGGAGDFPWLLQALASDLEQHFPTWAPGRSIAPPRCGGGVRRGQHQQHVWFQIDASHTFSPPPPLHNITGPTVQVTLYRNRF